MENRVNVSKLRSEFLKLGAQLKKFGKTKCKFHKKQRGRTGFIECFHPSMAYGGINRNTDCEVGNCPRILYNDHG